MSLVNRIAGAIRAELRSVPSPSDDYWYGPIGFGSASGMKVNPETAMRTSAVFACVNVISKSIAMLPLKVYQQQSNGDKQVAGWHPVYDLLYSRPNRWQTAYEFRRMMQAHAELRGIGIAEIIPGPRGAVDQLIPLHPDRVTIERLSDGTLRYRYADPWTSSTRVLLQEEVFRIGEFAGDGVSPLSTIAAAAETVGVELAAQDYGARFFENDAKPGIVLTGGNFKDKEAKEEFRNNWQESQTGANRHKAAIMPPGMDIKELGMKNSDAQYLELRKFTRSQVAAFFGVPGHKIGETDKAATFASVEQFALQFVIDCMMPRSVMWEQAIQRDLIVSPSYYSKHTLAALMRGDSVSRANFYKTMVEIGVYSPNDVRAFEEMNPREGGNVYLTPLNFRESGPDAVNPEPPAATAATDAKQALARVAALEQEHLKAADKRLRQLAQSTAERCVRKEVLALRKLNERNTANRSEETRTFYDGHAEWLSQTMGIDLLESRAYCQRHFETLSPCDSQAGYDTALASIELNGAGQLMQMLAEAPITSQAQPIQINVHPAQLTLNPDVHVESSPLSLSLNVETTAGSTTKTGKAVRGADGSLNFVIEEKHGN